MASSTLPLDAFDSFVREQMRLGQMPGAGISVRLDGVLWERGYGVSDVTTGAPMTEHSGVVIGSTTKALTCLALQQLADRGLLSLDDPIARFLPSFRLGGSDEPPVFTIRQAITHSAGLPPTKSDDGTFLFNDDDADDALARYIEGLSGVAPIWAPGGGWAYANDGYALAGRIIELLSGISYEEYMRRYVLAPLQLQETGFSPHEVPAGTLAVAHDYDGDGAPYASFFPHNRASAAGGSQLIMSASDAGRWLQALLDGGVTETGALASPQRCAELLEPQFPLPVGIQDTDGSDTYYALGWRTGSQLGTRILRHGGSTITMGSRFIIAPERRLAIAVTANSSTLTTNVLASGLLRLALGEQPVESFPSVDPSFQPDRSRWPELVGVYLPQREQNDVPGPLPIVLEHDRLRALTYPGDARRRPGDIHMRPVADLQFVLSGRGRTGSRAVFSLDNGVRGTWIGVELVKQ